MNLTYEKNKLLSQLGEELIKKLKKYEVFIAGGAITSIFNNLPINDIDLYFRSEEHAIEFMEDAFSSSYITSHTNKATTMTGLSGKDVQAIHFDYFESTEDIFNSFDYTITCGAYCFKEDKFFLHEDFLKHNSQRILKFNPNTAYPIISLLRIKKYDERGYTISKSEYIRAVLSVMKMEINSYDELKEQLGGMYGQNFDKLFEDVKDEDFSLEEAIKKLEDLVLSEDYFKLPTLENYELEDIINNIRKEPLKYFTMNGCDNAFGEGADAYSFSSRGVKRVFKLPDNAEEVSIDEALKGKKFYKFVKKKDGKYFSFWDSEFEYKMNSIVEASTGGRKGNDGNLYFVEKQGIDKAFYSDKQNSVLIEVDINTKDLMAFRHDKVLAKKCYVLREVPVEEYSITPPVEISL